MIGINIILHIYELWMIKEKEKNAKYKYWLY